MLGLSKAQPSFKALVEVGLYPTLVKRQTIHTWNALLLMHLGLKK